MQNHTMLRILHVSGNGFQGNRARCATLWADFTCSEDAILSLYTHTLLTSTGTNYTIDVQEEPVTDWGMYDAENGA